MNTPRPRSTSVRISFFAALVATLIFSAAAITNGQTTTTFGQFFERYGWNDFTLKNCNNLDPEHVDGSIGYHAHFKTVDPVNGAAVYFVYQNVSGLPMSLTGVQNAHLFVTSTTNAAATTDSVADTQPLNDTFSVSVIRDVPYDIGNGPKTNLLTMTFIANTRTPYLVGPDGGNSANIYASTPGQNVSYSSDFLDFSLATVKRNMSLSFSSASPEILMGAPTLYGVQGSFLQDFTAAGSGTFASNPAPVPLGPTSAAVWISGRVMASNKRGTAMGTGLGDTQVTLTQADGTILTVPTTAKGFFRIDSVSAGQTAMLTVKSPIYHFDPIMLTINDAIDNLTILSTR